MIKYLELTAPESSEFRQTKILSVEVSEGDQVDIGDALFRVKSGESKIDLPATKAGKIIEIIAIAGENISVMTPLVLLETEVESSTATPPILDDGGNTLNTDDTTQVQKKTAKIPPRKKVKKKRKKHHKQQALDLIGEANIVDNTGNKDTTEVPENETITTIPIIDVVIPDIGGDSANVIEILVTVGQSVNIEDSLVTLESDKASMDVPSSVAGVIESIEVNIDQEVSEGTVVVKVKTTTALADRAIVPPPQKEQAAVDVITPSPSPSMIPVTSQTTTTGKSHASPSIRRFARELGVDLSQVGGSGRKDRITKSDVTIFVKNILTGSAPSPKTAVSEGSGIPPVPKVDFTKFGEIDVQPLNKIKRLTATNLHRSWLNVPHVTHNDEANINDVESFRKQLNSEYLAQNKDIKLSPLAFIVKAVVNALQTFPQFNSSLEPGGENLIYKKYYNIGIAVETPNGLVVPVLKQIDNKSVAEIATEMSELAEKARNKKLMPADMSGACFTISSLGGIGGTHFSPIVNAPEVAILGVSRSKMQPVWDGEEFKPCMMLPLSLSYDHRVIDGAEAARFTRHIVAVLEDVRRLTV